MLEIIQFYRSLGRDSTMRYLAVAWLVLLSGACPVWSQEQTIPLAVGQPVAREMRGGEEHKYQLTLSAGQYARVVLDQKGIDVVLALLGADGKPLLEVDNNLSGTRGMEVLSLVADVNGVYQFNVRSLQKGASAGRYEVRIEDLRTATEADRTRVAAERSFFAGAQLENEKTPESRLKAIERYGDALRLMREAGERRGEAMTLTSMGTLYNSLGEQQKALEYLEQALTVWRTIGDRHLEAITLLINARVNYVMGEPQKALESCLPALPVMRAVGDQSGEAGVLTMIGTSYGSLGERQLALDHFEKALPLWRAVGDRRNEVTVLNNLGTVYGFLGEPLKALNYFDQVLPMARARKDQRLEIIVLSNIGNINNILGEPQKALEYLDPALAVARANGERKAEAGVLTHMGTAYSLLEDKNSKAIDHFERALQLRVAASDRLGEAVTLNHFGRAFDLWNEPRKALEYYDKALPIWRAAGDRNGEVAALYGIARAQSDIGELLQAKAATEAAVAIINTLRTKVASRYLRASYFASVQDIYKLHIELLMQLHRRQPAAGFDVAALRAYEQARARSLIDMLAEASADIRQGVDPVLLARERSLQQMLNVEAERQMRLFGGQHTEESASAIRRKIEDLLTQLLSIEAELKARSPRYAALTQPAPLDLAEIQNAVTDDSTVLLEYSLGEKRSYLWAVTATSFSSFELPPRAEIEAAVRRCYELLTARNHYVKFETADEKRERVRQADAEYPNAATALSQMLLGPVTAQLKGKRLLVVPDGALEYLPFAALAVPGQASNGLFVPLMVHHEVTSIPSASTLAVLRRELQGRTPAEKVVAVFADPVFDKTDERVTGVSSRNAGGHHGVPAENPGLQRLPYTRQEAEAILSLAPATAEKRRSALKLIGRRR